MFKVVYLPTGEYVRYGYSKKILDGEQKVELQYWLDFRLHCLCTDTLGTASLTCLQNKLYLFEIIEV